MVDYIATKNLDHPFTKWTKRYMCAYKLHVKHYLFFEETTEEGSSTFYHLLEGTTLRFFFDG